MDIKDKNVVVIGAGAIGLSCAYHFAKRGAKVTIIERQADVSMETSFANGAQISACNTVPWSAPGAIQKAIKWLGVADAPLLLVPKADPFQLQWLLKFAFATQKNKSLQHMRTLLQLSLHSRYLHLQMEQELNNVMPDFNYLQQHKGIYHIYTNKDNFKSALNDVQQQQKIGLKRFPISIEQAVKQEPALQKNAHKLCGVIYTPDDFSGDINLFSKQLFKAISTTEYAQKMNIKHPVNIIFNTEATLVPAENKQAQIVLVTQTNSNKWKQSIHPDLIIVSAASFTNKLLKPLNIKTNIYPTKGYAMNLEFTESSNQNLPFASISDDDYKIVWARLGNTLRAAGTAEISGYDAKTLRPERCAALLRATHATFPGLDQNSHASYWAGLRPLTPSNVPVIAHSKNWNNILVCSGHGSLGWTMMAGAGECAYKVLTKDKFIKHSDVNISTPWQLSVDSLEQLIE